MEQSEEIRVGKQQEQRFINSLILVTCLSPSKFVTKTIKEGETSACPPQGRPNGNKLIRCNHTQQQDSSRCKQTIQTHLKSFGEITLPTLGIQLTHNSLIQSGCPQSSDGVEDLTAPLTKRGNEQESSFSHVFENAHLSQPSSLCNNLIRGLVILSILLY